MAVCLDCAKNKDSGEFYSHPNMSTGHVNVCRECHKIRMMVRSRRNGSVQKYDIARAKRPARSKAMQARAKRWRQDNPEAIRAMSKVARSLRNGSIRKTPCVICGEQNVRAHIRDYLKPLDLIWLYAKCQKRILASFPELCSRNGARA